MGKSHLYDFLQHHPDKSRSTESSSSSTAAVHDLYDAYSTLSDDTARQEHDRELTRLASSSVRGATQTPTRREARISATVDLDAFTAHEEGGDDTAVTFAYPCRCGSQFVVTSQDLLTDELELVECTGCSEVIRVVWRDE